MPQDFEYQDAPAQCGMDATQGESNADRALRKSQAGDVLFAGGHFIEARDLYAQALRLMPNNARLLWLMGMCNWQLGQMDVAGNYLRASVRLDPAYPIAHAMLGRWYLLHGKIEAALESSAKALELAPQHNECIAARAWVLEAAGELEQAWHLVKRLVVIGYAPYAIAPLYARLAQWRGQPPEALTFITTILEGGGLSRAATSDLHFAAASLLDSMGHFDQAFAHVSQGNAIRRPAYNSAVTTHSFNRLIDYFSPARIARLPRASHQNDKAVFIVGMPRSGTSLVEQILASHPQIHGSGELSFMQNAFLATLGSASATEAEFPECLDRLPAEDLNRLAHVYLRPLIAQNAAAARITDKMPLNFMHLGLISILIPEARIIHCRRDPLDTCLSCHMTSFNYGNDFKYDLAHLGQFYRDYDRLMAHWKSVLRLPILDVDYEQLVADPKGQTDSMLKFLGLPWDDRCARFNENKRAVATSSVQQVRKPIYKSSLQRWRHYDKYLVPLKAALGPSLNPRKPGGFTKLAG